MTPRAGGVSERVARFLGNAAASALTDRYMHLNPDHFRGVVRALDAAEQAPAPQTARCSDPQVESAEAKVVNSDRSTDSENVGR